MILLRIFKFIKPVAYFVFGTTYFLVGALLFFYLGAQKISIPNTYENLQISSKEEAKTNPNN